MVGVAGIEPATLGTPCRCATKLRYTPSECKSKFFGKKGKAYRLTQVLFDGFKLAQYLVKQNVYLGADPLLIGFFFKLFLGASDCKTLLVKHIFDFNYGVNGFTVIESLRLSPDRGYLFEFTLPERTV